MSAAVVTALKKIAVTLLTDKKGRKFVGSIIAISVTLVLLPAMVLMAIGNHFSGGNKVNYDEFVQTLSEEQKSQISQMESDGKQIAKEMTAQSGKKTGSRYQRRTELLTAIPPVSNCNRNVK